MTVFNDFIVFWSFYSKLYTWKNPNNQQLFEEAQKASHLNSTLLILLNFRKSFLERVQELQNF